MINYPNYKYHQKIHNEFREKIKNIQQDLKREEKTLKTIIDLNHELLKLFNKHVKNEDKAIGIYLDFVRKEKWAEIEEFIDSIEKI